MWENGRVMVRTCELELTEADDPTAGGRNGLHRPEPDCLRRFLESRPVPSIIGRSTCMDHVLERDAGSRRGDDNALNMSSACNSDGQDAFDGAPPADQRRWNERTSSKGAMEAATAAALGHRITRTGHAPTGASCRTPVSPTVSPHMDVRSTHLRTRSAVIPGRLRTERQAAHDAPVLRRQSESALRHGRTAYHRDAVDLTHGLFVNLGKIGSSKWFRSMYRDFVADENNALDDQRNLSTLSGYRRETSGSILRCFYVQGGLTFPKGLLATAPHVRLRQKRSPTANHGRSRCVSTQSRSVWRCSATCSIPTRCATVHNTTVVETRQEHGS